MKVKDLFEEDFEEVDEIEIFISPLLETKFYNVGKSIKIRVEKGGHFQGDKTHVHGENGKIKVAWDEEGKKKHENKFPANSNDIPKALKQAVADKLRIHPDLLETIVKDWYILKKKNNKISLLVEIEDKKYFTED